MKPISRTVALAVPFVVTAVAVPASPGSAETYPSFMEERDHQTCEKAAVPGQTTLGVWTSTTVDRVLWTAPDWWRHGQAGPMPVAALPTDGEIYLGVNGYGCGGDLICFQVGLPGLGAGCPRVWRPTASWSGPGNPWSAATPTSTSCSGLGTRRPPTGAGFPAERAGPRFPSPLPETPKSL